jgi:hypothetical protein
VSCHCAVLAPESVVIGPRQTVELSVKLDLTENVPAQAALPQRDLGVWISPLIRGTTVPQAGWRVHGRVRSAFALEPRFVHFGESAIKGYAFPSRTVIATGHVPLRDLVASCNALDASARVSTLSSGSNQHLIEITPVNSLPLGPFRFEVTLRATTSEGVVLPPVSFPVDGRVVPEITVVPERVLLGAAALGQTLEQTVFLRSLNGKSFTVEGLDYTPDVVSVEPLRKRFPTGKAFRVKRRITKIGPDSSTVRFEVRLPDAEALSLCANVHCWGLNSERFLPSLDADVSRSRPE